MDKFNEGLFAIFFDNPASLGVITLLEKRYCCFETHYNAFWINNAHTSLLKALKSKA